MDGDGVLFSEFMDKLAGGLEEGYGFHIADGAADFHDGDIDIGAFGYGEDAAFDFIRNVGDDLNGPPRKVPCAFLFDDGFVDLARGDRIDA